MSQMCTMLKRKVQVCYETVYSFIQSPEFREWKQKFSSKNLVSEKHKTSSPRTLRELVLEGEVNVLRSCERGGLT